MHVFRLHGKWMKDFLVCSVFILNLSLKKTEKCQQLSQDAFLYIITFSGRPSSLFRRPNFLFTGTLSTAVEKYSITSKPCKTVLTAAFLIIVINQMTVCYNVKEVTCNDISTENYYHPTQQLRSFGFSFRSWFGFLLHIYSKWEQWDSSITENDLLYNVWVSLLS